MTLSDVSNRRIIIGVENQGSVDVNEFIVRISTKNYRGIQKKWMECELSDRHLPKKSGAPRDTAEIRSHIRLIITR